MKMIVLLFATASIISSHAEESFLPNVPSVNNTLFDQSKNQEATKKAPASFGKGLILLKSHQDVVKGCLSGVKGLQSVGVNIPGGLSKLADVLDPLYMDKSIDSDKIKELKLAISNYYAKHGRPVVTIQVPSQDITDGVLQLVIIEGKVGKVSVEGNKWFKSERYLNYLRLKPNEEIDESQLMEDINFINRNPFRRADVIYAPGEQPGMTDIQLLTTDHGPIRAYSGGENNGVYVTGRQRWIGGVIWPNAWGIDHILSIQYSTSADFHKFQAYTGNYEIPLPWKHVVLFYGGYSTVHGTVTGFPHLNSKGNSAQASGRYKIPLKIYSGWVSEAYFGIDWKRMNNTIEFGGLATPIVAQNANLFQVMVGYAGSIEGCWYKLSMDLEVYGSPFRFLPNQSTTVYDALVPGANVFYAYGRSSYAFMVRMPLDFSFSLLARGQLASSNLLPSEQYGIGGFSTVRGYDERQLNYEQAILASGELRSPAIGIIKRYKNLNDALQFLAFYEWGFGQHHTNVSGGINCDYLMGIGAGMRYSIQEWFNVRFDWGHRLRNQSEYTGGSNMIHFAVIGSY